MALINHVFFSFVKPYNVDQFTAESAGSATAILTGVKTNGGMLSVNQKAIRGICESGDGNEVNSILHHSHAQGWSIDQWSYKYTNIILLRTFTDTNIITRNELHKEAKLLSLEQRREKQLLILMYKLSQKGMCRKVTNRPTRQQEKYVFKTDTKIGNKYEKSAYYIGTKLWDKLPTETQFLDTVFELKKKEFSHFIRHISTALNNQHELHLCL